MNDRTDEGSWCVVLAAVSFRVAHIAELGFVEVRQLMLLLLRAEAQTVDQFQRVAQ